MRTIFVPRHRLALALLMAGVAAFPLHAARPVAVAVETAGPAAAQAPAVEPMPDWVRTLAIPEATKPRVERAQDGVVYLLNDAQYRSRPDGHDDWFRLTSKVINRSGLESAGQITMAYNPAFETLGIHFVHLIRDGKVIDLTRDTQFRVVEREDDLEDGIVSGTMKVIANLRDVRVGDIVDYATTVHARSSLWAGHAFYGFSQRFSEPLAMRSLRFVWPEGMTPRFKAINSDIAFPPRKTDRGTEWEWSVTDPAPMKGEDNVPGGVFQWGLGEISTMRDWGEVAAWATGLYRGDDTLPADFAARLDAIAKASPAPADRLTAATRYIQDNIRYVGEELGEGSFVPRRPGVVLARGYGDCKDKSLLLAVALRRLGIDAVPALVSTTDGPRLTERLPSPLVFDHVIVRAVLDGRVLWIDPTGTHRGGRGTAIVPSNLGHALPIRDGQAALEPMAGYGERAGRMTVVEEFAVDEKAEVAMTLHVVTRYTDARADQVRGSWASTSARKIADNNLAFYRKRFPELVEGKPLVQTDDRDANVVTMVEDYTMSRAAFDKAKLSAKLITRAYAAQDILPDRQDDPRRQPLALPDHVVNEQTIDLRVKDRLLEPLEDVEAKGGPVAFSRRSTKLPEGLHIVYRLDTGPRDMVPAAEAEAVYAVSEKVSNETGIEFYLEKSPRPSGMPAGLAPALAATIRPDLEKLMALIQKPDQPSKIEALSLIAAMSEKLPHPSPMAGMVDGLKAAVLSDLRRPQAALAAFQSATAQFDGNPEVFRMWIAYELDLGTPDSVVKALQRTRAAQPAIVTGLEDAWVRAALQKIQALPTEARTKAHEDLCIVLSDSEWQQSPRTAFGGSMLGCAIVAQSRRGDLAAVRAGLARTPPTPALLALATDRRHQPLWGDMERLVADGFRQSLTSAAASAEAAARAAPRDYKAVTEQMRTLRTLGRYQEAIAAGKALATDTPRIEMVGHDGFWLANEYAENLQALGRTDEAVAQYDRMLALGIEQYPELVSLAINRAEMLTAAGRYQASIDSLTALEAGQGAKISLYGKMWIWSNRACAQHRLGHAAEAKADEDRLAAKPAENWSATTAAAACRGDVKAIGEHLIARLRAEDSREQAIGLFLIQPPSPHRTSLEAEMVETMDKARALPEVQAELAKYGRAVRYAGTAEGWGTF
ncbi:DUF3857 domain-containing protein [Sphingomonas sp. NCPPB 2930]|uniref:DUF3857 domain-containing protein n=1 Tax=Sphingomonas sp. NCPPB 2930 TaxID=3162788 RepID=UPI0036DC512E